MFITMDLGTSMSREVRVRLAELGTFPVDDKARVIEVRREDSLWTLWRSVESFCFGKTLICSFVSWGNLYFLNSKDEDEQKQLIYNVFSRRLNVSRRDALTPIQVIKSVANNRRPMKLWTSEAARVFLQGSKLSLKCIVSGLPTPNVIWRKINGTIPERRSIVTTEKPHADQECY
jgi:hypothetical protein